VTTDVAATIFESPDELLTAVGRNLGTTPWFSVDRESVSRFERATATRSDPSDRIPPFMLVSLTNYFLPQLLEVRGISSGVNYGSGSIRFGAGARVGDRLNATATIVDAVEVPGGVQTAIEIAVSVEGDAYSGSGPACVVESLSRWLK
jgi:hypothetical protein